MQVAVLQTNKGSIVLKLRPDASPKMVDNFVQLSAKGFYNGMRFHRVIDNFIVQSGCPKGTGVGGPGYMLDDEINEILKHDQPGVAGMANAGPHTNGSQFYITRVPAPWLDDKHSTFAQVIAGQEVVDKIEVNDTLESVIIEERPDA